MVYRVVYRGLLWLLLPMVVVYLCYRSIRQPAYRRHWLERFGFYSCDLKPKPLIWLHAVSVGESRAAMPLLNALRQHYPQHQLLLTHMTPTGRETARQLCGDAVVSVYLPYDYPSAVKRFLQHFKPSFGIVLETEWWPNLMACCARRRIPLYLVNVRLSEQSLAGYRLITALIRPALQTVHTIATQTEADQTRLSLLFGDAPRPPCVVMGNLKFEGILSDELLQRGRYWRQLIGVDRPVMVAASTRDGEEGLLLAQLSKLPTGALLILIPRHPQRFAEVAALLARLGIRYSRRSQCLVNQPLPSACQVLLGDSMDELQAYYAAADVAFIGGSLVDCGGQNPIEALKIGVPVVMGFSCYNFAEVVEQACRCGCALQCNNAMAVMFGAARLLADKVRRESMAMAAQTLIADQRGAVDKVIRLLPENTKSCIEAG